MRRPASHDHPRRGSSGGFTLVELMVVVAIIAMLSAIAVPAYSRHVKRARTAEAAGHLSKMWRGAVTYYQTEHTTSAGVAIARQFPGDCSALVEADCCSNPDKLCKGNDPVYQNEPWTSLTFTIADKHRYRPVFYACPDPQLDMIVEAWGDQDCDGTKAVFKRVGRVNADGDVEGYTRPAAINEIE